MCGIVAILSPEAPLPEDVLRQAMCALRHRGPDGDGAWVSADRRVGLGHRRLSVIDLETGGQPLASEDGAIHAVVNGEFYDFDRTRRDLERKGHRFASGSDSEIVVHLYEEHGAACLKHLRGEFAFALWDGRNRQLFAARDRFGVKPLCFAVHGNAVYLASEAKALFAAGVPAAWDAIAWFQALSMQYAPPDRTLFHGVAQLRPGHYLLADGGRVETFRYWDLDFPTAPGPDAGDEAVLAAELRERLDEAVRLRLRADVPVCCHLSGGLDSSAVAASAAAQSSKPVPCFAVSFAADGYDEAAPARAMAHRLNAEFHVVPVSQADLLDALPDAVYASEGLAVNGHLSAKYLLHRAVRRAGFKVVLTGEGADEVLAGYPHLHRDLILAGAAEPEAAQRDLAALRAGNAVIAGIQLSDGPGLPLDAVRRALGAVPSFLEAKAAIGLRMRPLLAPEFRAAFSTRDCFQALLNGVDVDGQLAGRHRVDQATYLWAKLALATYILKTLGDGTEMAHGVEGRVPFLDHPFHEFARRLPLRLKIKDGVEKHLLRVAVRDRLTDAVFRRRKHPFTAPPVSRFSSPALDRQVLDLLHGPGLAALPFFDRRRVLALAEGVPDMSADERKAVDPVLMMVLTACLLQERFGISGG